MGIDGRMVEIDQKCKCGNIRKIQWDGRNHDHEYQCSVCYVKEMEKKLAVLKTRKNLDDKGYGGMDVW